MKKLFNTIVSASVLLSTTLLMTPVSYGLDANTLPVLTSATNGSTSVSGNRMDVYVDAPQGGLSTYNWGSYNVGSNAQVNYAFGHQNQTALNLVAASGGMSQIYGKITQSTNCPGCDYSGTGKVILLNPNGVFFGNGADVNLNSFTVSSFDGVYNKDTKVLELTKGANSGKVVINDGAKLYGDKNLAVVAPNIEIYNGSKLTTNVAPNVGTDSYGKIKLVTADGVNFNYYNNGAIKQVANVKNSTDKMMLFIGGELTSGNVDARNMSTNADSEINLNGAVIKATQAVSGNDGNVYLTASNKVVVDNSNIKTQNYSSEVTGNGGNISIYAGNKASVKDSTFDSVNNALVGSVNGNAVIEGSNVTAKNIAALTAEKGIASLQKNATLKGKEVSVIGGKNAQVYNSTITATNNANITGGDLAWVAGSKVGAGDTINVTSTNGDAQVLSSILNAKNINVTGKNTMKDINFKDSTLTASNDVNITSTGDSIDFTTTAPFRPGNYLNLKAAKDIKLTKADTLTVDKTSFNAGKDVYLTSTGSDVVVKDTTKFIAADNIYINGYRDAKTSGTVNLNRIKTTINAGRDVDVTISGADDPEKGIIVNGCDNVTVTTPGTLSVSSLVADTGNMTINADKVIAGKDYTTFDYPDKATTPRSYIEVKNGKFISNTTHDSYDNTHSYDPIVIDGKNYNQRHLIQYGNGAEKILLVNNIEFTPAPTPEPVNVPDVDGLEAYRTLKLPQQADQVSKVAPIADNRTIITDVFAAASQIEIVEDDED
ncbi:filamentous hemagglutinin N-terminal domain-containing protein [bacterium]|nr:filamentous hemagglutinin N-terminal domain-containing protein [bacterium]